MTTPTDRVKVICGPDTPGGGPRVTLVVEDGPDCIAPELTLDHAEQLAAELLAAVAEVRHILAGDEQLATLIWRAEHDTIPLGTYTTSSAAADHCRQLLARTDPAAETRWVPDDEDDPGSPVGLDLRARGACTWIESGYAVTPVPVLTAYDPDADE